MDLPFEDNFFDVIIDRQSVGQNNYNDIKIIVSEIYRVLKSEGKYFGINFSDRSIEMSYGNRIGKNQYNNFTKGRFDGIGERHFFNFDEIFTLFDQFEILNLTTRIDKSFYNNDLGVEEIIVIAKKKFKR